MRSLSQLSNRIPSTLVGTWGGLSASLPVPLLTVPRRGRGPGRAVKESLLFCLFVPLLRNPDLLGGCRLSYSANNRAWAMLFNHRLCAPLPKWDGEWYSWRNLRSYNSFNASHFLIELIFQNTFGFTVLLQRQYKAPHTHTRFPV